MLLHEILECAVRTHPERLAVVSGERRLSFDELPKNASGKILRREARSTVLANRAPAGPSTKMSAP